MGHHRGGSGCAGACLQSADELVDPQAPTVIDQGAVDGPTGANGLRVGALGAFKMQTGSARHSGS
jgi:hypothetical protein